MLNLTQIPRFVLINRFYNILCFHSFPDLPPHPNRGIEEKSLSWRQRLKWFQDLGHVPGVTNAPYLIVIAEHRGIPDLGQHALAHCLENMWLKATALNLGFEIISVMSKMGDDEQFCRLLGLRPGEWDLMGCAVGYSEHPLSPSIRPTAEGVTVWLP
ncbi:MAG: nitroreductase family protein [Syntrophales bacterium]